MTTTLELHLPDELAEAIEDEYVRRRASLTDSMRESGWTRQAELVEEQTEMDADDENEVAVAALALLAAESDYYGGA